MRGAQVTVVTVTYNAVDLVGRCLDALESQNLGDLTMDVVVVDNGSTDGTAALVAARFPHVRLIEAGRNLGFAAGNNVALTTIDSPWIVLLNNDAVPEPGFVASLVRAAERAGDAVAAVAARVLLETRFRPASTVPPEEAATARVVRGPDGAWIEDPAGACSLVNSTGNLVRRDGFGVDRGWLADASTHHPERDVFGFSGAAALLRRDALTSVGLFDERLFMYYEDTDLSWRLRRAGWRIEYCEDAVVRHLHSATSGEGSEFFRFHDARNRLVVLTKNASGRLVLGALLRFVVTTASILLRGSQPMAERTRTTRWRLRALGGWLTLLPHALRERRRISSRARLGRREIEAGLAPIDSGTDAAFRA